MRKLFFIKLLSFCLCLIFLSGCRQSIDSNRSEVSGNGETPALRVSSADKDAAEPAIASAPDGSLYIVWVEHSPDKRADVFIRHFDDQQKPLREAVRINQETGGATAWRGDPPTVRVSADGTVYVGWTASVAGAEGSANDLYLSISRDGAKTFDAAVKVNDDQAPAVHGMHALEVDKSGRIFFAWLDERYLKNKPQPEQKPMEMNKTEGNSGEMKHQHSEPNREVYFAVSSDGGKSFSANKRIAENVCPCCKVSATTAPDGRIYFAWRQVLDGDFRHIAVTYSTDDGDSFAPYTIVSNDKWQIAACPVSGAGLITDSQNTLKVVWYTAGDAGTPGIYQAESKDGGKTFAPRILISDKGAGGTPVVVPDTKENLKIVFSAVDKSTHIFAAQNSSVNYAEQSQIENAELPGAIVSKDRLFIDFIRKDGEKRGVFLTGQN